MSDHASQVKEQEGELFPRHYNDMDEILGDREAINPRHVLESSATNRCYQFRKLIMIQMPILWSWKTKPYEVRLAAKSEGFLTFPNLALLVSAAMLLIQAVMTHLLQSPKLCFFKKRTKAKTPHQYAETKTKNWKIIWKKGKGGRSDGIDLFTEIARAR